MGIESASAIATLNRSMKGGISITILDDAYAFLPQLPSAAAVLVNHWNLAHKSKKVVEADIEIPHVSRQFSLATLLMKFEHSGISEGPGSYG